MPLMHLSKWHICEVVAHYQSSGCLDVNQTWSVLVVGKIGKRNGADP
jgi:hypothetical protein